MSHAREVLEEVREQRLAEARIHALQKSWYTQLWPILAQAPWLLFILWSAARQELPRSWPLAIVILLAAGCGIAGVIAAMRTRDRMWRDLIRRESPALHQKLSHTDG